MASEEVTLNAGTGQEASAEDSIELAKRAIGIKNYEQAVEHYAAALEIMTEKYGEASPKCVDLYFAYGKALLENAIAQNSVLGKEETGALDDNDDDDVNVNKASGSGDKASGKFVFGEDQVIDAEDTEESTVDLFAEALKSDPEPPAEEHEGETEDEPEDDFNAAWEVLELARSLYDAQQDSGDEIKLKLADTYMALGDISLETEKLEQAVTDFKAAAKLKEVLLPQSSRQIAEVHYKLCIVHDMTPGQLSQAIEEATKAQASVRARLDEIKARLETGTPENQHKPDVKGKGKAKYVTELALDDMNKTQLEAERKDLQELLDEVSLKIDELKTSPDGLGDVSAPEIAARELDRDLNSINPSSSSASKQVNDLTSIVKKKRKVPESIEDMGISEPNAATPPEKKTKMDA